MWAIGTSSIYFLFFVSFFSHLIIIFWKWENSSNVYQSDYAVDVVVVVFCSYISFTFDLARIAVKKKKNFHIWDIKCRWWWWWWCQSYRPLSIIITICIFIYLASITWIIIIIINFKNIDTHTHSSNQLLSSLFIFQSWC